MITGDCDILSGISHSTNACKLLRPSRAIRSRFDRFECRIQAIRKDGRSIVEPRKFAFAPLEN
jgi:hypothetical protein